MSSRLSVFLGRPGASLDVFILELNQRMPLTKGSRLSASLDVLILALEALPHLIDVCGRMLTYADVGASLDVLVVALEALLHLSLLLLYCCFTTALLTNSMDVLVVALKALLHLSLLLLYCCFTTDFHSTAALILLYSRTHWTSLQSRSKRSFILS